MNVVTLIGNLATDVELRDRRRGPAGRQLPARGRPAGQGRGRLRPHLGLEQAGRALRPVPRQGAKVGVDGRLRSSSWEDADGNKRNAVEVVANRVEFLSPPPRKGGSRGHPVRSRTGLESAARGRPRRDPRLRRRPARARRLPGLRADGPAGRRRARGAIASPAASRPRSSSSSAPRSRAPRCSSSTTGCSGTATPRVIDDAARRRLKTLFDADITLAAYHLALDAHPEVGNNALLARELGVEPARAVRRDRLRRAAGGAGDRRGVHRAGARRARQRAARLRPRARPGASARRS